MARGIKISSYAKKVKKKRKGVHSKNSKPAKKYRGQGRRK